ncbi:MAG: PAS domain S-box protein, partial [Pseudomonadota bacterium]
LAAIVEHSNDAIIGRALDDTITSWNAAAERLFGYTAAEVIGRDPVEIFPPEFRHRVARRRRLTQAGQSVPDYETVRVTKEGRRVDVAVSLSAVKDTSGRLIGTASLLRDITERKRADEAQARLAAIVECSNDAIISRVIDGAITSWNAAAERILGYTAAEVIGRDPVEIFPPELRQMIAEHRKLLRAGQLVPNYETVRITKDGRRIEVSASVSAVRDASGRVIGIASILRDISDRKRLERELRHKTEIAQLLEQLARAANEAVSPEAAMEICLRYICEEGKWALGRVATFPPGLSQRKPDHSQWFCTEPARFDAFMRYSDGSEYKPGIGRFIGTVLCEQRPVWLPDLTVVEKLESGRLEKAVETGFKAAFAFPVIVKGEVAAILEFFATETRPPDALLIEGTTGLASQFARLVERSRANETQAKLAAIVENSNDAIIGRAIDGTITSWNAAAERILGYTAAEVIGRDLVETFPPEARQQIAVMRNLVRTGQSVPSHEVVRITKDGRRIDVTLSISSIRDNSGNIMGTATILHDISELKRAEQILRNYAERLQTVSRKLLEVQEDEHRRLARELHDQVGQVLTALKINLQVIENQPAAAPVALKIEECAQIADAALQQLRTLMLDLRPPQLDELGLAVALRAHAERVVTPANLALHFSGPAVPPQTPPAVEIVCFRIAQEALTNILRHAGARNVWIELAVDGDGLKLAVRDDGKGFDLAEAHRRAIGGGSIGLLSMEERTALADGRLEISTAPGAGTTVRAMFSLQAARSTVDTA